MKSLLVICTNPNCINKSPVYRRPWAEWKCKSCGSDMEKVTKRDESQMKKVIAILFLGLSLSISTAVYAQNPQTGSLTAASSSCLTTNCVTLVPPASANTITLSLSGTWTATVQFEYRVNDGSYAALPAINLTTLSSTLVSSSTANGNWAVTNANYSAVRLRVSAFSSGPITAQIKWGSNEAITISIPPGSGGGGATQDTNLVGINGVTPSVGSGINGSGVLRTAEATDSILGGTVTSSRIAVNPISSQAGVAAGAGAVGATVQRVTLASDDPLVVAATASSTPILANGLDDSPIVTVKASAGVLDSYFCYNGTGAVAYIQIFDISGTVTLGTSVPKWSIGIPTVGAGNMSNMNLSFSNAIKVAATTTPTGSTGAAVDCNFGEH